MYRVIDRDEDGVSYTGVFEVTPRTAATREEPADGGAICVHLSALIHGHPVDTGQYVRLDPGLFPSIIADMTEEAED